MSNWPKYICTQTYIYTCCTLTCTRPPVCLHKGWANIALLARIWNRRTALPTHVLLFGESSTKFCLCMSCVHVFAWLASACMCVCVQYTVARACASSLSCVSCEWQWPMPMQKRKHTTRMAKSKNKVTQFQLQINAQQSQSPNDGSCFPLLLSFSLALSCCRYLCILWIYYGNSNNNNNTCNNEIVISCAPQIAR